MAVDKRLLPALVAASFLGAGGWAGFERVSSMPAEIIFLDVGQGDSTIVRYQNTVLLVDVGPKHGNHDAGSAVVSRLRALGVRPELILLTHPDLDHIGGITSVHRAFPRAKIAMSEVFRDSEQVAGMMQEARLTTDNMIWLPPKCVSHFGRMTLTWFAPHLTSRVGDNDHSVVVKIQEGRSTALLTGDSGFPEEGELLAQEEDWKVDVLKAGHHGSKNSTSPRWLAACQPKFLAISCGLNNSYGHPHPYVLSRAEDAHAKVVRTDKEGEIRFRSTDTGFQLVR